MIFDDRLCFFALKGLGSLTMNIAQYLEYMKNKQASDLFFSAGFPVLVKIQGSSAAINKDTRLSSAETKELAYSLMNDQQIKKFDENMSVSVGISVPDLGRFRLSVFRQRGSVAMVIRCIKTSPPSLAELQLPERLGPLMFEKRGLILVAGATGSGKSSTLAAMIDFRNTHAAGHILTIEDPIEYLFSYKKSIVNQREVSIDARSYSEALKSAMREAPDVIMIGEIRDTDTMKQAVVYSETGHLCLATIHASNAVETLDRIINFFPPDDRKQILIDLSRNLHAVICQRLVKSKNGTLMPALEVLKNSPYFSELIQKGKIDELTEAFDRDMDQNVITFDQSLIELYKKGHITAEEAVKNADSKHNIQVQIRLKEGHKDLTQSWEVKN